MEAEEHVIIIGAGLFGLTSAIILAEKGFKVTVIEKNYDVMLEATLVNQNRIHYGYHYPRSLQTGREALDGLEAFKTYYNDCLFDGFKKYYGIAKNGSHLTSAEFSSFCDTLGIPLEEEWPDKSLLNHEMLDSCWRVYEPVFDYYTLRLNIMNRIADNRNIRILRNAQVSLIEKFKPRKLRITLNNGYKLEGSFLINATYSGLTDILKLFNEEILKAKYQLLVLPILKMEKSIDPFGITIMDGPFCSLVPRGFSKDEYILSHVVHSVIQSHLGYHKPDWNSFDGMVEMDIVKYASQFYPVLENMKLKESWITTKMILPNQEVDDARPTLLLEHDKNIFSVFSGKVTTCVTAAYQLLDKVNSNLNS